ncbi:MAG: hypothetical protein FWD57_05965, partial [Polyangiaceae bacterium]|nr:hypothetical protein [Polyangiaceae bacterium]
GGDFAGGDFAGGDFAGGDFAGGDFAGGDFAGGDFAGGDFAGGDFAGGDFAGGDFAGGDFAGGDFAGGDFASGDFAGGDFAGGDFAGGDFVGVAFAGGDFVGGDFAGGDFAGGDFAGGDFAGGDFGGEAFAGAVFACVGFDDDDFACAAVVEPFTVDFPVLTSPPNVLVLDAAGTLEPLLFVAGAGATDVLEVFFPFSLASVVSTFLAVSERAASGACLLFADFGDWVPLELAADFGDLTGLLACGGLCPAMGARHNQHDLACQEFNTTDKDVLYAMEKYAKFGRYRHRELIEINSTPTSRFLRYRLTSHGR